jgi:hypothetical protein
MLVESGPAQADTMGLDVFLQAKKTGLGVYQRLGFQIVSHIIQHDSELGGEGGYGAYFLVRSTKPKQYV